MAREVSNKMTRTICVFGGIANLDTDVYDRAAYSLGEKLALSNYHLVCSGTNQGAIGRAIDGVIAQGGKVSAIVVDGSGEREILHPEVKNFVLTPTLAERKSRMQEMSDAFIALPGGIGTLDEIFNVIAASRMGLHSKKIGLLNVQNFFSPLSDFLEHLVASGFAKQKHLAKLNLETDLDRLLEWLR